MCDIGFPAKQRRMVTAFQQASLGINYMSNVSTSENLIFLHLCIVGVSCENSTCWAKLVMSLSKGV